MATCSVYAKHDLEPISLTFSIFSTEEIKKISVCKIHTTYAFDALGHPLPGGLYDIKLGPASEKGNPCGTCCKNFLECPGHFGYIELPLPVVNLLFRSTVTTLLQLTCIRCFQMQVPIYMKKMVSTYMQLLNNGFVTEALEMDQMINEVLSSKSNAAELPESAMKTLKKFRKLVKYTAVNDRFVLNKTTESLRNQMLTNLARMVKVKKNCIYCQAEVEKYQTFRNRLLTQVKKDADKEDGLKKKGKTTTETKMLTAEQSRRYLRNLWDNHKELISEIFPVLKHIKSEYPTDVFFFEVVPVPPCNIRPTRFINNGVIEHPQSQIYKTIIQDSIVLRAIIKVVQDDDVESLPEDVQAVYNFARGSTPTEKLHHLWQQLQSDVDCLIDCEAGPHNNPFLGLKQVIEKKKGIIRMHMMGKRVNYAARSVITPDPNLNIDEIGIPEEFACKLTYPVPVTSWNVEHLRKMVLNGPNVHPGARMIELGDGTMLKIGKQRAQQESIVKRLLTPAEGERDAFKRVKIVHRHLCNGDVLLLNRQPTLHKPSIMAHTARILKGEKTIRLHYANCKAYNADFDGDEMNVHFPQNELARSEGYTIVNVCNQYLVPKDGSPLSGLIQDHMISGVKLSVRGKFFAQQDYHQLVYQALSYKTGHIVLLPPAILKPVMLWSGKQILSTVIINTIPRNKEPINLTATAKISPKNWITYKPRPWKAGGTDFKKAIDMSEAEVIIRQGQLLCGVLDKTHYGATRYGLVHCMYELYGGQYASKLLSSFAKLFTCFLQQEGFTLGVRDILIQKSADKKRAKLIEACRKIGHLVGAKAVDASLDISEEALLEKIEVAHATNPKFRQIIDRQYKQELDTFTNEINKVCLPAGLICKFPENNLQLMVESGAKGSTVNTMQISCLLGQIELEGKRPPVMISGKSLPSFIPYDTQPRAGGFIDGRFMTGILPQEFFFHCMAGREGLIDTAVKTSRSGYLQRCLVKHLEGLRVCYDLTVRDSDQSVVQFFYGEDGMDISKVQFLKKEQLPFFEINSKAIVDESIIKELKAVDGYSALQKHTKKLNKWKKHYGDPLLHKKTSAFYKFSEIVKHKITEDYMKKITGGTGRTAAAKLMCEMWENATPEIRRRFESETTTCPNPLNTNFQPDHYFGALDDRMTSLLNNHVSLNVDKDQFSDTLKLKAMQSLCCPGEPVGLLAAQSVGEPSTQMTLNTFHFAGRGEMNVTLGIPRLREILMTASATIKTPSMEIPFLQRPNIERETEELRKLFTRVTVANVLEKIDVHVRLITSPERQLCYTLNFQFLPSNLYNDEFIVKPKWILKHMKKKFFNQMFMAIRQVSKISTSSVSTAEDKDSPEVEDESKLNTDDEDSSEEEPEDVEDAKLLHKYQDKLEDQEPSEDEAEKSGNEEEASDNENSEKKTKNKLNDDLSDDDEEEGTDKTIAKNYSHAQKYTYDKKEHLWCTLTFCLPMRMKVVDLSALLKKVAEKSVIWQISNIKRAITYEKDNNIMLRTDGININELFKYDHLLDLRRLYSNDIHKIASTYGIEAARRVIVKEVKDVFNVYGITVDARHLLLIADYMTYNGKFEPLSRKGMESSASPLQQISFESSLTFLKSASMRGKQDFLSSPSSCLMIGKPCTTGTGSFTLLQKIPTFAT